jgi:hypothetical protein
MRHSDEELNILRWAGMALAGFYAFRVLQKEGTLTGVLKNPQATKEKAHALINTLGQHLGHYVKEPHTQNMLQSLGHQLVEKLIDENIKGSED